MAFRTLCAASFAFAMLSDALQNENNTETLLDWKVGNSNASVFPLQVRAAFEDCGHECDNYHGAENQACIDKCNQCSDEGYNVKWQGDIDQLNPPISDAHYVLQWRYVRCMQSAEAGQEFEAKIGRACINTEECPSGYHCVNYCLVPASATASTLTAKKAASLASAMPADARQNENNASVNNAETYPDWKVQVRAIDDCGHDCGAYTGSENQECINKCNQCSDEGYNVQWQGDIDQMNPPMASQFHLQWRYVRCMQSTDADWPVFWLTKQACVNDNECPSGKTCMYSVLGKNIYYCNRSDTASATPSAFNPNKFLAAADPSRRRQVR